MTVLKLSEKSTKSDTWTIEDTLEKELERVRSGERHGKAMIMYLDDSDGKYNTGMASAGFHRTSELVSLLEVIKMQTIAEDMDCI